MIRYAPAGSGEQGKQIGFNDLVQGQSRSEDDPIPLSAHSATLGYLLDIDQGSGSDFVPAGEAQDLRSPGVVGRLQAIRAGLLEQLHRLAGV